MSAAEIGGRVTCVSLARRRRWWVSPGVDDQVTGLADYDGPSVARVISRAIAAGLHQAA